MVTLDANIKGKSSEDPKLKRYEYFFLFNVNPNSLPKIFDQNSIKSLIKTEF